MAGLWYYWFCSCSYFADLWERMQAWVVTKRELSGVFFNFLRGGIGVGVVSPPRRARRRFSFSETPTAIVGKRANTVQTKTCPGKSLISSSSTPPRLILVVSV